MINIKEARSWYTPNTGLYMESRGAFTKYSPGYVLSNEYMNHEMSVLQPAGKSVLTVAGSGDHPFYFKLHGAAHIDTFDVSYCAKAIMDLKTAAIQNMNQTDYIAFVRKLAKNSDKIKYWPEYEQIQQSCPADTTGFVGGMSGCKIGRDVVFDLENIPLGDEFTKLKSQLKTPFNFIWTDLDGLSGKLTQKYDVICLSNIIQYYKSFVHVFEVVHSLMEHLNKNGRILLHASSYFTGAEIDAISTLRTALVGVANVQLHKSKLQQICIVKKL